MPETPRDDELPPWEEAASLRGSQLAEMLLLDVADRPTFHISADQFELDLLASWDFVVSNGQTFSESNAKIFKGCRVVVWQANSTTAQQHAERIAALLSKHGAARVQIGCVEPYWPEMEHGDNLVEWESRGGGTAEKLYEILDKAPEWKPRPHLSKFGRIRWADQEQANKVEYEWWVKGIIPKRETCAVVGATQTGKSFETFNLAMHIARGVDYRGHRTKQGLVIYCAMEGGKGFRDRMRGYRAQHGLDLKDIPFEVLTRRADLFSNEVDMKELIAEIQAIAAEHTHELALVVIDTYSAATPGLKENTSEDISRVRQRVVMIEKTCNCGVLFVDHTNAVGDKARGHTSKTADIETQLNVEWVMRRDGKDLVHVEDEDRRRVRRLTVFKQREGESGKHWDFVLKRVDVRVDSDGDQVTTCVSMDPRREEQQQVDRADRRKRPDGGGFWLKTDNQLKLFKALLAALDEKGFAPPGSLLLPKSIAKVVKWIDVGIEYRRVVPIEEGEDPVKYRDRIKKRLRDAREVMLTYGAIGVDEIKAADGGQGFHVAWPTGKRVAGLGFEWPAKLMVVAPINNDQLEDDLPTGSLF